MRTIETTARILPDGTVTIQLPPDVAPGDRRIVLVIEEPSVRSDALADVDAAFAVMAMDADYQQEARQIEAEFAGAQWEALQLGEAEV
jgi:hypothetical protein